MKRLFAAGAVLALFVSGAGAADLDERTNRLDPAPDLATPSFNPTGFYVNGELGWAWLGRDFDREFDLNVNGTSIPLDGPDFTNHISDSQDVEAFFGGGGISYLRTFNNFGVEIGVNADFYGDNLSVHDSVDIDEVDDEGDGFTAGRTFSFERDHDIDLLVMGHYFFNERMSVRLGAGPSWASASANMGYEAEGFVDGESFGSAFAQSKPEDNALGIVARADLNYWPQDDVRVTLGYVFKRHEFEFENNGGGNLGPNSAVVTDTATVEDDIHAIKASLGLRF